MPPARPPRPLSRTAMPPLQNLSAAAPFARARSLAGFLASPRSPPAQPRIAAALASCDDALRPAAVPGPTRSAADAAARPAQATAPRHPRAPWRWRTASRLRARAQPHHLARGLAAPRPPWLRPARRARGIAMPTIAADAMGAPRATTRPGRPWAGCPSSPMIARSPPATCTATLPLWNAGFQPPGRAPRPRSIPFAASLHDLGVRRVAATSPWR